MVWLLCILGRFYYQRRQNPEALAYFNQLLSFFGENNAIILAYRGKAHQAEGHNEKAADDYQHALTLGIADRELRDSVRAGLDEVRRRMSGNRQ